MNINKFINNFLIFVAKRLIEIFGAITSIFGILLLLALISYSPEDPNFIFPENAEIENLMGVKGSYASDVLYQSIGLISLLLPISASSLSRSKSSSTLISSNTSSFSFSNFLF